ncbi:MAG: hypothetical protein AAGF84_03960 [Planctomycetota bacterium]
MTLTTPFSLDRDLLAACPTLLRDGLPAARVLREEPSTNINNGLVTASVTVHSLKLDAGSILTIDDEPYEVTGTYGSYQCFVSKPLSSIDDGAIAPANATGVTVQFVDFKIHRVQACEDVCRRLGLGIDPSDVSALLGSVTNPDLLTRLEVFRALELIFEQSESDAESALNSHYADFYRGRFAELIHHCPVQLDVDGDGVAEQERRFDVLPLVRQ